ncbi:DUF3950 domain-containing protein [Escherichia coli]|nr:DUF3950 domain-containing protein [Escherichia coli]
MGNCCRHCSINAYFSAWVIEACRRRLSTERSGMNYIIK